MCPHVQQPLDAPWSDQEPAFDLAFPAIPSPSPDLLAAVGEESLRALVTCHHQRLRRSSIGDRFPADAKNFDAVVQRISNFIVDTARGFPPFAQSQGGRWLRIRHFPITIDETARNVWLAELLAAFDDVEFPQQARSALWLWLEALSIAIINRRTMISQPRRYPFADAPAALRPFTRASQQK
jgi:hemoglobin